MKRALKTICLVLVLASCGSLGGNAQAVQAKSVLGCRQAATDSLYTGSQSLEAGDYEVYVKLGRRGQTSPVSLYSMDTASNQCQKVGNVGASGDTWRKIGTVTSDETTVSFGLVGDGLGTYISANRPSIMLLDEAEPTCNPSNQCILPSSDDMAYIVPVSNLADENTLRIELPRAIGNDAPTAVFYYVDNDLVYTTGRLQPFDMRYVSAQGQLLRRVVQYDSGQKVVYEQRSPDTFTLTFSNFVFKLSHTNPVAFTTIKWVVGLLLVAAVAAGLAQAWRRRQAWRRAHGFVTRTYREVTPEQREAAFVRYRAIGASVRMAGVAGVIMALLAAIVIANTYILKISRVDGVSMRETFRTNELVWVNSAPVTWKRLTSLRFVPKRGDVVIVRAVYGVADRNNHAAEKEFLIKRVIGLPGERVVIKNGGITVYNRSHPDGFNPDAGTEWAASMIPDKTKTDIDLRLGLNELFVSGDNRPASIDSRYNGPIDSSQVVGVVLGEVWPF